VIYRVFDFSSAALAEMMVRQERARLLQRFQSVVVVSGSLSVLGAVLFAVCNQPFVHVWSSGKIGWPVLNDVLLAVWMVISVFAHGHVGLVGQTKQFRALRYMYLLEGLFFTGLSLLVLPRGGVAAMVGVSIVASLIFTLPYGLWRTSRYFGVPWRVPAWKWAGPAVRVGLVLTPAGGLVWWLVQPLPPVVQLAVCGSVLGVLGAALLLWCGLEEGIREELLRRCPERLRPWLGVRHRDAEKT
jgi:O-antigen/teichoic acid export membrane protein